MYDVGTARCHLYRCADADTTYLDGKKDDKKETNTAMATCEIGR